jgi:hypothetical protein
MHIVSRPGKLCTHTHTHTHEALRHEIADAKEKKQYMGKRLR